ncbi:MAG: hypothetical protein V4503_10895 [Gemmatimonadota bacterium]
MPVVRTTITFLLILALAACNSRESTRQADSLSAAAAPAPAPDAPSAADSLPATGGAPVARADGFNGLKTGWPLARFNTAIGEQLRPKYDISDQCDFVRPASFPAGVMAMVVLDTIVRFDITQPGVLTAEGVGIGDSESRIQEVYAGMVATEPHKYTGPVGHYLVVTPPGDTLHRIIFETDGKTVLRYRVGNRPAVEYIEGCS